MGSKAGRPPYYSERIEEDEECYALGRKCAAPDKDSPRRSKKTPAAEQYIKGHILYPEKV